jgi:hypothetical protein
VNGPDFSIILAWHEDRFSRNDPLEYGYWIKPIRDSGVILETPTGAVDWESLDGHKGLVAQHPTDCSRQE